jgi:mannose-1-phosphate guanylyltransferase
MMGAVFYAVIPAGGSGTRLWPLSRSGHPKFLHALTGTRSSLLQSTVERLSPLSPPQNTYVVTGLAHAAAVARQLPALPEANIVVEPSPRESCPAIALAAALIARRDPRAVMGSFAADHLVRDPARFVEVIRDAIAGAQAGLLLTVGITPTQPETAYGYIEYGDPTGVGAVRHVRHFKEKPTAEVAAAYLRSGHHLWNAGIFVWRVDVFLDELRRQHPDIHAGVTAIAQAWDGDEAEEVLAAVWPTIPRIAVDYAVMEGAAEAGKVATVPGDFGWTDVGDFRTLGELITPDESGNVVIDLRTDDEEPDPTVVTHEARDLVVVPHGDRVVALVGVRDLIVVDTPDAVLVCDRHRAQDVKRVVDALKAQGRATHT